MAKLIRRLRRQSPVRAWLDRRHNRASGDAEASLDAALLDRLQEPGACDWKDRAVAYQALGECDLSPEARRRADQLLVHALTPQPVEKTLLPRIGRAVLLSLPLNAVLGIVPAMRLAVELFGRTYSSLPLVGFFILLMLILGMTPLTVPLSLIGLWIADAGRNKMVQRAALSALVRRGDPADIVSLYPYLHSYGGLQAEMLQAFRTALPALDESRRGHLSPEALRALEDMSLATNENLALEALKALQRVGDMSNIDTVAQIAEDTELSKYLRDAARIVLERVQNRPVHETPLAEPSPLPENSALRPPQEDNPPTEMGVGRWERKLARHSPIRLWLSRRRANSQAASATTLLRAMEDPNASGWADRAVAYQALDTLALDPSERRNAARLLLQSFAPTGARDAFFAPLGSAVTCALIASFAIMLCLEIQQDLPGSLERWMLGTPLLTTLLTPLCFVGISLRNRKRKKIVQKAALETLARVGDPETIPRLVWAASQPALRQEALQALREILPTVDASWYGRLPDAAGPALALVAESEEEALALAALDALEAAGSGSCMWRVKPLTSYCEVSARVRERAAAILPVLIARREQERVASSLLRPSDARTTDHLVRPVYSTEPNTEHLLRASQSVGSETAIDRNRDL